MLRHQFGLGDKVPSKKIARRIDLVLTLYPFEALMFKENSVKAEFVGHPVASNI